MKTLSNDYIQLDNVFVERFNNKPSYHQEKLIFHRDDMIRMWIEPNLRIQDVDCLLQIRLPKEKRSVFYNISPNDYEEISRLGWNVHPFKITNTHQIIK